MQAFIAHANEDQAVADELRDFLKPRGIHAQCESGVRGFRPLHPSDVVIGLWSRNTLFSTYRMVMERRLLEAWSEGRLVLVKLDHQVLPVGMRDLPSIAPFAGDSLGRRKSGGVRCPSRRRRQTMWKPHLILRKSPR